MCGSPVDKQELAKLVGDNDKLMFEYPWTTVIYMREGRNYDMIASGYLIRTNVVITGKYSKICKYTNV